MLIKNLGLILLLIFFCSCTSLQKIKRAKENIEIINAYLDTIKDTIVILKSEDLYEVYPDSLMLLDTYKVVFDKQSSHLNYTETINKSKIQNPKFIVVKDKKFNFKKQLPKSFVDFGSYTYKFKIASINYYDVDKAVLEVAQICFYKNSGRIYTDCSLSFKLLYEKVNGKWQREKNPRANLKPVILPNGALRLE